MNEDVCKCTGNYVASSQTSCLVAYYNAGWLFSVDDYDPDDYGLGPDDDPPDISLDPDSLVLSVINASKEHRSYFITVEHPIKVNDEAESGQAHQQKLIDSPCTTMVLVLKPSSSMDVCQVVLQDDEDVRISSDIKEVEPHTDPNKFDSRHTFSFPLGGEGPYLCSQGFGGHFTHFYPGTYHAVDFECPVGTPVIAVGDGEIIEVQEENELSGVHVDNLFKWNSVMLKLTSGEFVEYVHIKPHSCVVAVGDRVVTGQQICLSGNVGFCPSPHLHIQAHLSGERTAETIKFAFQGKDGKPYFPVAGKSYGL